MPIGLLMLFVRGYSVFTFCSCFVRFVACVSFIKSFISSAPPLLFCLLFKPSLGRELEGIGSF